MKPLLRGFDEAISALVGRLPASLQQPAHRLGYLFVPPTWLAIMLLFTVLQIGDGRFWQSLVVTALVPLATIIKLAFRRKRPPTMYAGSMKIKSYSFPSSHAYAAALAGGYLAAVAFSVQLAVFGSLLIMLGTVIGVSRVYLGAHYPSDVIGGWLTALIALRLVSAL